MKSVLVTGSNRGLGLEWVRQYADNGWRVYATCRFPEQAGELQRLAAVNRNVSVLQLDITCAKGVSRIASLLGNTALDRLINNAGVYHERWGQDLLGQIDYDAWQDTFAVNTLGAMRVSEALCGNLSRSKQGLIVTISSHMGSIADIGSPNDYAYRSSKSALNVTMKGLSLEVKRRGIGVVLLHPGWVRTRMGGQDAPLSPGESVAAMRKLLDQFTASMSGHFYRYDGSEIPW